MTIIISNFNGKIRNGKRGELVGEHGLDMRNERKERMKLFL